MSLPNSPQVMLEGFKAFLGESGLSKVSIKNYQSDIRHFFNYLESKDQPIDTSLLKNISEYSKEYQSEQISIFTPSNSINRRLASIRRFTTYLKSFNYHHQLDSFAEIDQKTSPTYSDKSTNQKNKDTNSSPVSSQKLINQFRSYLKNEKKTSSTIKNYCSDLYHYFAWIDKYTPYNTHHLSQILSKEQLNAYVSFLKLNQTTSSVINRRQSSIKKLTQYSHQNQYISTNPFEYVVSATKITPLSWFKRFVPKAENSQNAPKSRLAKVYYKYHQLPFTPYLHLSLLVLATTTMAILAYNQVIKNAKPSSAATSLTAPKRQLSFQGRLSDSSETPITTTVNVNFKLWDSLSGGTQLYTTGTCSVTPDSQGIFNSLIGDGTCGSEIPMSVFADNRDVYLEVGVGAETLTPRQQIATVGYALNSETLQGYPASESATINTIPVIDNSGNINIAASSPSIVSTSGNFTLTGESLSLTTATNSGGDIILQPDALGSGQILAIGGTTTDDTFRVTNANLTSGSLISGYIGNDTATGSGNLLQLSSGATETAKFRVTADGRTTISTATDSAITASLIVDQNGTGNIFSASSSGQSVFNINNNGNINTIGGISHSISNSSGDLVLASNSNNITLNDNVTFAGTTTLNGQTYIWPATSGSSGYVLQTNGSGTLSWVAQTSGGVSFWDQQNGTLYPLNSTVDFLLGGQASDSAKFAVINLDSGTPTASLSAGVTGGTYLTANGNLQTTANQTLTLGGNTTGNITLNDNTNITGHTAIGTNTTIDAGATGWGSTFSNLLTIQDTFTDMSSLDFVTGITNDIILNPSSDGNNGYAAINQVTVDAANSQNINAVIGTASYASHAGTGTVGYISGGDFQAWSEGNGTVNNAYGLNSYAGGATNTYGSFTQAYKLNGSQPTVSGSTIGNSVEAYNDLPISSGNDYTYGNITSITRTGATGGNLDIYGQQIIMTTDNAGAGTSTAYGTYVLLDGNADNNYSGVFLGGNFGIGDNTPASLFTVGNGDLFQINSLGQISSIGGVAHYIYDNAGDLALESNSNMILLDASITVGGNTTLNSQTYTWPATAGSNGYVLQTNGSGTLSWVDISTSISAASLWQESSGATFPKNSTTDFLVGGQATDSAKFAVLNIDNGTPVASISSGLSGNSSFLSADGILGTSNFQTLTIGNSTTGNIALSNSTKNISIDSSTWDITGAGVASGFTGLTSSGTINFSSLTPSTAVYTDGSSNLTSIAPTTGILGFWQRSSGVLSPWFITDSINVGATATTSALAHFSGVSGENSFFLEPLAIGFDASTSPITNPGLGGGNTALQVDGDILPGIDDDAYLGRASTAWSRLYLSNGINNSGGTEQISILNRNLTGGQWNATSTFRVGDSTKSMPTGIEFYTVGDASISATFTAGGNSRIIGDLATDGNVTIGAGTGKLDVGTVDPPYTINGQKYATYFSGMIGVKEEVTGSVTTNEYIPNLGYRKTINFQNQEKGSDLWLFSKTTNLIENLNQISVLLTPNSQAKTWYDIDTQTNTLYIYSSSPANISYRFTAPRFDSTNWQNTRTAGSDGFIINSPDQQISQNQNNENIDYSVQIQKIDGQYALLLNNQRKNEVGNFSESLIANLTTGLATINELITDNLTIKGKLVSPIADIGQLNAINASISGTLTADNIKSKTIDKLNEQLGLLEQKYSTASSILADIQNRVSTLQTTDQSNDPLQVSPLATTAASLPEDFSHIINTETIYTDDILANSSIFTKSLSSFDTDLYIQPTGDKPVHLLANLLNLYPNGQIVVNGDIIITGNIFANNLNSRTATISGTLAIGNPTDLATESSKILSLYNPTGQEIGSVDASGSANFNTLQTSGLVIASQNVSEGTISGTLSSNSTIGTATIATGSSEIYIQNNLVNESTLIYVTPISNTANQVLYIKSKQTNGGFTVAVPQPVADLTSFNYWLVQTK